jgi:2'-5' RNA ligase
MSDLLALDVAILPPPDVRDRAIGLNADLRGDPAHRLALGESRLPHVTLTQQFIRADELEPAFVRMDDVLRDQRPLTVRVTGGAKGGHSVWMAIESTAELMGLHERLMEALRGFERPGAGPAAFFDGDARAADVLWVGGYRLKSSFGSFAPHITLGRGGEPPHIDPFTFRATTVAACHLGRFCSCRRVSRSWELA